MSQVSISLQSKFGKQRQQQKKMACGCDGSVM